MTIASKTTAASHGLAKRLAAFAVAAAALLTGGVLAASAAADETATLTNVAANAASGNDNAPDIQLSYSAGWQGGADALNDGVDEAGDYKGWGTWGNTGETETATYLWNRAVTVSSSTASYYTNVVTGDGGLLLPKSADIQYLAEDGAYHSVPNLTVDEELPETPDQSNYGPYTYTFDAVTTTSLKLVLTKRANDNSGITVGEWQVFGVSAPIDVDPGSPDAFLYTQQVAVRTTPGVDPTADLPKQVWVTPENGPSIKIPVTWETVPASAYASAGVTEVKGATVEGVYDGLEVPSGAVTATIGVYDQLSNEAVDAEYVSTVTTPGVAPVLQDTIAVTYADGSVESGAKVSWDDIDPASYAEAEQMGEVEGTVDGTGLTAYAMFFVVEASPADAEPIVSIDFNADALGASGWYTSTPVMTVTARRGVSTVPVDTVEYRIGDGEWTTYAGPVNIQAQGEVTLHARATDAEGRSRETSQTIKVDTNAPTTTAAEISRNGKNVVVQLTASDGDNGSGVTRTLYSTGPSASPTSNENTMWGTYTDADKIKVQLSADHDTYVHFYSQDAAGHNETRGKLNLGTWDGSEATIEGVTIAGEGIKDGAVTLKEGTTLQLTAAVIPDDAANEGFTWTADGDAVTVGEDGLVTAVKKGEATVTATTADGQHSTSIKVTVIGKDEEPDQPGPEPGEDQKPGTDDQKPGDGQKPNKKPGLSKTGSEVTLLAVASLLMAGAGTTLAVRRRRS